MEGGKREAAKAHPETAGTNNDLASQSSPTCISSNLYSLSASKRASQWGIAMNWTGGSLQRTKNANKGVVQKQKAYFARARTQIQNKPKSPVTNFCPSYLRVNEDLDHDRQISTFRTASLHQIGHSSRPRTAQLSKRKSRNTESPTHYDDPPLRVFRGYSLLKRAAQNSAGLESDTEGQILEANRERLLKQADWIGIASSKPVSLQCARDRVNNNTGKRRKTSGKLVLDTQQVKQIEKAVPHPINIGFARGSAFQTIRNKANPIQIQIGSNALASTHSIESNNTIQSYASSESMLFDQEAQVGNPEPFQGLSAEATALSQHEIHCPIIDESFHCSMSQDHDPKPCQPPLQHASLVYGQTDPLNSNAVGNKMSNESSISGYHIKYRSQGIEQSLRFVFGKSDPSVSPLSDRNDTKLAGEVRRSREPTVEHPSHGGDIERPSTPVDKEKPWRRFLAISHESSNDSASRNEANVGSMQPTCAMSSDRAFPNWSQATVGFQTEASTANVPASSHSSRKSVYMRPSGTQYEDMDNPSKKILRNMANDERLWQAFVFGNEDVSPSEKTTITNESVRYKRQPLSTNPRSICPCRLSSALCNPCLFT